MSSYRVWVKHLHRAVPPIQVSLQVNPQPLLCLSIVQIFHPGLCEQTVPSLFECRKIETSQREAPVIGGQLLVSAGALSGLHGSRGGGTPPELAGAVPIFLALLLGEGVDGALLRFRSE